jgi:hypothetical protein
MPKPEKPVWRTLPYISASGASEVLDYLEELKASDLKSWLHFKNICEQIVARGPFAVGPPYWEGLGDGLFEISWGHNRVYCSVEGTRVVMMYVAVYKLWKKFRPEDRKKCEARRADVQSVAYDEQQREYLYLAHCQRRGKKNGSA